MDESLMDIECAPVNVERNHSHETIVNPTDFIAQFARALHHSGMACHRLEALLIRVTQTLKLQAQMLSLPTAFIASFEDAHLPSEKRTVILRMDPGGMDLYKQSKLILLGRAIIDGKISLKNASSEVSVIERGPGLSVWLQMLSGTIAAAAACRLFGGGLTEMCLATLIGFVVSLLTRLLKHTRANRILDPLAAIVAAIIASLGSTFFIKASPTLVVLGGLMMLLPGYAFTVALDELAARHLVAGTARLMGALTVLLFLGLSVLLAGKLANIFHAQPIFMNLPDIPLWIDFLIIALGLLGLGIWFRTPWKDLPWVLLLGGIAEGIERLSANHLNVPLAASLAAFFLTIACNSVARIGGRVANAILAPALMLLVPGSLGLKSLFALSEKDVISGIETGYQMLLIAIAIVTGLLLGNLLIPSQKQNR